MTTSIALFDCPHCIDEFSFDYQKIAKLAYGRRVRVRCPGCGNIVEVVMLAYTLIHNCDPGKYKEGEITQILPPDPKAPPGLDYKLRMAIHSKKTSGD